MARRKVGTLTVAAAVGLIAFGGVGNASVKAEPAAEREAVTCVAGYFCLQTFGGLVLVPQGQSRSFESGLLVSATANSTALLYCVTSNPVNYALSPGGSRVTGHTVYQVGPGSACPM